MLLTCFVLIIFEYSRFVVDKLGPQGMKKLQKADWTDTCADKFKAVMQKL